MIEVLPSDVVRGIQLVGLLESYGRDVPIAILLAFVPSKLAEEGPVVLQGIWVEDDPSRPYVQDALLDLLLEKGSLRQGGFRHNKTKGMCPVCGRACTSSRVFTGDGLPICPEHLGDQWERQLKRPGEHLRERSCARCARTSSVLWMRPQGPMCTRCMAERIKDVPGVLRWILFDGTPLEEGRKLDMALFLESWRLVSRCSRCGSRRLRIRKIQWEFPKAMGPIVPLWQSTGKDSSFQVESERRRQLEIYTHGMLKASVECPQCGYSVREFLGTDVRLRGHPVLGEAWRDRVGWCPPCEGSLGPPSAPQGEVPKGA